jgi:hypothetical protein
VNGYQCLCPTVFSGTNCARLQEQCTGIECLNGGRCISNGTQFVCLCPIGYQGDNCELIIDYCQSQPVRKKNVSFCFAYWKRFVFSVKMVVYARILN